MSDIYFIECFECGFQVSVTLDKEPTNDTKILCDSCKQNNGQDCIQW